MNKDTKNMTNANNEEEVEVKVNNITPRNRRTMWIIIAAAVVVLFAGLFAAYSHIQSQRAIEAAEAEKEQILLDVAQKELEEDYDALNERFRSVRKLSPIYHGRLRQA